MGSIGSKVKVQVMKRMGDGKKGAGFVHMNVGLQGLIRHLVPIRGNTALRVLYEKYAAPCPGPRGGTDSSENSRSHACMHIRMPSEEKRKGLPSSKTKGGV
ncbi:hypothetical protein EYF80_063404 [Liparis tanakae]|uniref:Uncharacterized protein n=1 Tax=Liparis tanakae TaxID=230148 RepID=A0A4Z2ECA5_9TELE|nr:hypothetical protein EYF80_063404 [Liparis tanakae]